MDVVWRAFELRPQGAPPIPPEYRARIEAARPRLNAIAKEQYGLELKPGPFGINSRPALVGAKFAEAQGVGKEFHRAVMRAYWEEARDIGAPETLAQLAEAVGLPRAEFLASLHDASYDRAVQEDIDQAAAYGLSGVPAIVFDMRYLVSGAQPYPVLVEVTEKVLTELAAGDNGT